MSNRTVWIYVLTDPRTDEIKYVGQSCNPSLRYRQLVGKKALVSPLLKHWTNSLREYRLKPKMIIIEETEGKFAGKLEQVWIKRYKDAGNILLNQQFYEAPDYRSRAIWWTKDGVAQWNT